MKKKKKRILIIIFFLFFILGCFSIYYLNIVFPVIKTYSKIEADSITEKAINTAISNVINRSLKYDSLIDINYSNTGEIVSFSANQYEINTISREIIKEVQYQLNFFGKDGLKIKMGTFSGIPLLIDKGPVVKLNLVPIGVVTGDFFSEFDSVGINMTKHSLFLHINVHVSLVMPVKSYDIYTTNQILLAESIIMGKVPEVYLNGQMLNNK